MSGTTSKSYQRLYRRTAQFEPIDGEEWRRISDEIEVSSYGRVRLSVIIPLHGSPVTDNKGNHSYLRVKARGKNYYIHTLVAEAFLGPRPIGFDIHHKDANRWNNTVENLEYVTRSANLRAIRRKNP
jgi:hypothetical protein